MSQPYILFSDFSSLRLASEEGDVAIHVFSRVVVALDPKREKAQLYREGVPFARPGRIGHLGSMNLSR